MFQLFYNKDEDDDTSVIEIDDHQTVGLGF